MPYIPGFLLALLAGGRVAQKFLAREDRRRFEETPYMWRLLQITGWEDEFKAFFKENRYLGEYKALRKFFTEERMVYAVEQEKKLEAANRYWEEERRRGNIKKRIYAYQYEDFLFSLYAPLAIYDDYKKKWKFPPFNHLPEGFVIHKIAEQFQLSNDDALTRFTEFVDNGLLHHNTSGHWCELGVILEIYPNIVSANDMNINKWIEIHGQSKTKSQLLAEVEQFKCCNKSSAINTGCRKNKENGFEFTSGKDLFETMGIILDSFEFRQADAKDGSYNLPLLHVRLSDPRSTNFFEEDLDFRNAMPPSDVARLEGKTIKDFAGFWETYVERSVDAKTGEVTITEKEAAWPKVTSLLLSDGTVIDPRTT